MDLKSKGNAGPRPPLQWSRGEGQARSTAASSVREAIPSFG